MWPLLCSKCSLAKQKSFVLSIENVLNMTQMSFSVHSTKAIQRVRYCIMHVHCIAYETNAMHTHSNHTQNTRPTKMKSEERICGEKKIIAFSLHLFCSRSLCCASFISFHLWLAMFCLDLLGKKNYHCEKWFQADKVCEMSTGLVSWKLLLDRTKQREKAAKRKKRSTKYE